MAEAFGATIERGADNWQIFQQDENGRADIAVGGRWGSNPGATHVEIRLVREDSGMPVTAEHDWTAVKTSPDGTWSGVLRGVPAGGLYRLETHLRAKDQLAQEWSQRGDMRHFLGVGDLWIIAGQSNSAGYGRGPVHDGPELGVHLFNNSMRWALASQPLNESTDTAHPANRESSNNCHSPWLHWARLVRQETGLPIGLIQTSLGGSPLAVWNPTEPGEHPLYETMAQAVKAAGGKVRGMLWYQGCSDAGGDNARTYEQRFISAVRAWRKQFKNPAMHVLTVQINRVMGIQSDETQVGYSVVREAQRRIPKRINHVTVVPTLDLPLSDGIHTSASGNMLLAQRAAYSVLAAVYGRKLPHLAPDPVAAKRIGNGDVVEIAFDNVTSRLDNIDPLAVPFRVECGGAAAAIRRVEYAGKAVRLHLVEALTGKAVVHGAFGANPPQAPVDMIPFMPMLSFYGLPVE